MKTLVQHVIHELSNITSDFRVHPTRKLRRESLRSIQQVIPRCATQCVVNFISTNFPPSVCPNPEDLHCLCTKRSSKGLTIGEGAVQCLLSTCSTVLDLEAYGICSGLENALPNTHSALTVTVVTTPSAPENSDATYAPTSTFSRRTSSAITTPAISITSHADIRGVTTVNPSTRQERSVSSTLGPATTLGTTPVPTLTSSKMATAERSRIIGLSVGAAVVGLVLLGILMFLCARKRRRKIRQQENHSFDIGGDMSEPQAPVTLSSPKLGPVPPTPIGSYNRPIVESLGPLPKVHISPARDQSGSWERRPFVADDSSLTRSPRSLASQTSASRPLPKESSDNGTVPRKSPVLPRSPKGTIPREYTRYHELPSYDPGFSPVTYSVPRGNAYIGTPQQSTNSDTWFTYPHRPGERSPAYGWHLSPCRTPTYSASSTPPCEPFPTKKPMDHELSPNTQSGCTSRGSRPRTDIDTYSHTRITHDGQNTFVILTKRKQTSANYRDSTASVTSFETTDSDNDERRYNAPVNLSPVKEYPSPELRGTGSFSTNRPRYQPSSSQPPSTGRYPLGPPSKSGVSTGSLLAKRRGESFAGKLEHGFIVPSTRSHRTRGPVRGLPSNPRSATRPPRLWERQLTQTADQLWSIAEPSPGPRKLTPTRDGNNNLVLRFD